MNYLKLKNSGRANCLVSAIYKRSTFIKKEVHRNSVELCSQPAVNTKERTRDFSFYQLVCLYDFYCYLKRYIKLPQTLLV